MGRVHQRETRGCLSASCRWVFAGLVGDCGADMRRLRGRCLTSYRVRRARGPLRCRNHHRDDADRLGWPLSMGRTPGLAVREHHARTSHRRPRVSGRLGSRRCGSFLPIEQALRGQQVRYFPMLMSAAAMSLFIGLAAALRGGTSLALVFFVSLLVCSAVFTTTEVRQICWTCGQHTSPND